MDEHGKSAKRVAKNAICLPGVKTGDGHSKIMTRSARKSYSRVAAVL
jgi:hypothetical protein